MPYNGSFTKMVGDTSAEFKTEITSVQDNVTEEVGAPVSTGGKYHAKGDLNEIIQELINNDVILKMLVDKVKTDLSAHTLDKDNPHKTTRVQVGLGSVENYGVTSSVSDSSNTKYATAGAVKVAYDKGTEALNKCPYRIGDILTTTLSGHPKEAWPNTDWQKIEGRYLKGTSGGESSKSLGGSMTKTLTADHMPIHTHGASGTTNSTGNHTHTAYHDHEAYQDGHDHTRGSMNITGSFTTGQWNQAELSGAFYKIRSGYQEKTENNQAWALGFDAARTWVGSTSWAQPRVVVNAANVTTSGSGTHTHSLNISLGNAGGSAAFDIQPAYYTVHYWLRIA